MKFDNYELKDFVVKALNDLKFKNLTEVQKEVLNQMTSQRNLLVKSKTGSGKTHSFLIPIFDNINPSDDFVQALIISPTNELALQTYKVCQHMASFSSDTIRVKLYGAGTDRNKEIEKLEKSQPHIVIATPGKLKDLVVQTNALKIHKIMYYVIDEVDMTLESGFQDEIDQITDLVKDSARMMFFSATMNESILPFIQKYMPNNKFIELKNMDELNIDHYWIPLKHKSRDERLFELLEIINPYLCIIFCNKKETAQYVANLIKGKGYSATEIHGDVEKRARKHTLNDIANLKYQYVVASDLASRGIDIDGVSHVINYDIPKDFEFYLHRSGRTGRMNYSGIVYSFFDELDSEYLDNLSKKGIVPEYKDIKNQELVDTKERDSRKNRVRPESEIKKKAKSFVHKPLKVTPGYKKKMAKEVKKIEKKLRLQEGKKRYYRGK